MKPPERPGARYSTQGTGRTLRKEKPAKQPPVSPKRPGQAWAQTLERGEESQR